MPCLVLLRDDFLSYNIGKGARFFLMSLLKRVRFLHISFLVVIFLTVFITIYFFQFSAQNPTFIDGDSFYHVEMAKLMLLKGFVIHQFPYLQFSVLKAHFVDSHFLFHVILIPFIKIFGDINGPKILTAVFLGLTFCFVYLILKNQKLKLASLYTFILFFSLPEAFYLRMMLIRAPVVSLFLLILGIYLFLKNRPLALSIVVILYVYTYYVASPLILVLIFSYLLTQIIRKEKIDYKMIFYPLGAFIIAFIVNPYFPDNIRFIYNQIYAGFNALPFEGAEHLPILTWDWVSFSVMVLILFFSGMISSFVSYTRHSSKTMAIVFLTIVLLFLQWKSERFMESSPLFLGLTGFLMIGEYLETTLFAIRNHLKELQTWIVIFLIAVFIQEGLIQTFYNYNQLKKDAVSFFAIEPTRDVANYLNNNSKEGDIVFSRWDIFSVIFYYDQKNYYVGGLDPVFTQKYNQNLFNQYIDLTLYVPPKNLDVSIIKTKFNAKWVITFQEPWLDLRLKEKSKIFKKVFRSGPMTLYRVL